MGVCGPDERSVSFIQHLLLSPKPHKCYHRSAALSRVEFKQEYCSAKVSLNMYYRANGICALKHDTLQLRLEFKQEP